MNSPYPQELLESCEGVHWYEPPIDVLNTPHLYLQHVMSHGTDKDILIAQKYYSKTEFINALDTVGAGKFSQIKWDTWRDRLGLEPKKAPRRYEDDDKPLDWWKGFKK